MIFAICNSNCTHVTCLGCYLFWSKLMVIRLGLNLVFVTTTGPATERYRAELGGCPRLAAPSSILPPTGTRLWHILSFHSQPIANEQRSRCATIGRVARRTDETQMRVSRSQRWPIGRVQHAGVRGYVTLLSSLYGYWLLTSASSILMLGFSIEDLTD